MIRTYVRVRSELDERDALGSLPDATVSARTARARVEVVRELESLPAIAAASGSISWDQLQSLVEIAPPLPHALPQRDATRPDAPPTIRTGEDRVMAKRKYSRSERRQLPTVRGTNDVVEIVKHLVCDEHTEGQLLLGIDASMHLCGAAFNCPCSVCQDPTACTAEALVAVAEEMGAEELVLVTFVADDRLAPTAADVARYEGLRIECLDADVLLLDHLLFSGHQWRSVAEVSWAERPGA